MLKKIITKTLLLGFLAITIQAQKLVNGKVKVDNDYEVATYYFPSYHVDAANEKWHGKGWSEWDLVKAAKPRFKGHEQPKVPTWGFFDEADPKWAAKEIDLAADNGVDIFIYDWYWYEKVEGNKYLHGQLEDGFLKAPNRNKLKFALMWANHDWNNIHPANFNNKPEQLTDGEVSMETWQKITDYVIANYFKQPNYWKLDGKPYFSIYELNTFMNSFGSYEKTIEALKIFEDKTIAAGFPGLHLNVMALNFNDWALTSVPWEKSQKDPKKIFKEFNVASSTSYCFVHHYQSPDSEFPFMDYAKSVDANVKAWDELAIKFAPKPYFPSVSVGWDVTPRTIQTDKFENKGYPWMSVFKGNTPEAFKKALLRSKQFIDKTNPKHKIVIINAWNEWTEGSYLLPEKKYGEGYLKAIKSVFGN